MTIVMTGATSGIGKGAAARIVTSGADLLIGARGGKSVNDAAVRPLDLSNLGSVRAFAEGLRDSPIEALVLNAGGQRYDDHARSADGFELTFAVNHLAHYLLARLLLPLVADGGRIIFTSSGTHDPAERTPIPPPRHADAFSLAYPERDPERDRSAIRAGMRAYSSSKLCNVMTARSFAALPVVIARRISVHAYDPGLTPQTGLVRGAPWWVRTLAWPLLPLMLPFAKGMNSLADSGNALAGLSDGTITSERVYMSLRAGKPTWPEPSMMARDDDLCARLWRDSALMVGLPD